MTDQNLTTNTPAGTASAAAVSANALIIEEQVPLETSPTSTSGTMLSTSGLAQPGSNVSLGASTALPTGQAARVDFAPAEQAQATQSFSMPGTAAPR